MITVEGLKAYGADTEAGLARCMNQESFYLRLVSMQINDGHFQTLQEELAAGHTQAAFEAAHALKGALGNLGLTPLYTLVSELTEKLRGAQGPVDVGDLPQRIARSHAALQALLQ